MAINLKAINLYKKNGFELEGVLRKNIKHNDKLMDDYVMSIVK
jgi:RimJ/RimL family protein N-acetyltransferase